MKDKDRTIESLKTQLAGQRDFEKNGKEREKNTSSHGYVPGCSNKAELAPSCKITMAAKASRK